MEKRKYEDVMCKMCLFYDDCNDRVISGCFTPIDTGGDREIEDLIESKRISYRAEYFSYIEQNAD